MLAGTHKFAERPFLATECALNQFRLRRVNLRFAASQPALAPDLRSGHEKPRSLRFGDIMLETCTRGRGSLALLFALNS
jgi:hypothetical protein